MTNKLPFKVSVISLVLSILVSCSIYFIYRASNYEYDFVVEREEQLQSPYHSYLFNDYNFDGISEIFSFGKQQKIEFISFKNHNQEIIEQYNFKGEIRAGWVNFFDINKDNCQEMFVFNLYRDTIFLSIINLKNNSYELKNFPVEYKTRTFNNRDWDPDVIEGTFIKNGNYWEYVFGIIGCYSVYPRKIYKFNINRQEITNTFSSLAPYFSIDAFDLDRDGEKEIIAFSHASRNIQSDTTYDDFSPWLFVLNNNLEEVFPAITFPGYYNTIHILPLLSDGQNYIAAANSSETGEIKNSHGKFFLIDKNGTISARFSIIDQGMISGITKFEDFILLGSAKGYITKINGDFNIVETIKLEHTFYSFIEQFDINGDGVKELFIRTLHGIAVLDKELNTIAYHQNPGIVFAGIFKAGNFPNGKLLFTSSNIRNNYYFSIHKNQLYAFFPYISLLLAGILFFSINHSYLFITQLRFSKSIQTYIYQSPFALIIFGEEEILYCNKLAERILSGKIEGNKLIENEMKKFGSLLKNSGCKLNMSLNGQPFLAESVKIEDNSGDDNKYIVTLYPGDAKLSEDRLIIWSKTIQKIAHDIKTPLSTIQLNLKNLEMRLDESNVPDKDGFIEDINMVQTELHRINRMTKEFLKLADLSKPVKTSFDIGAVLDRSINHFKSYFENGCRLEKNYDENLTHIYSDPNQIEIVFNILIENAIDAVEGSGNISNC